MEFDLHIKNIGKLTDAKIRIGRFTVLAGPNNTGKSFVSKIVYSLVGALNDNTIDSLLDQIEYEFTKTPNRDTMDLGTIFTRVIFSQIFSGLKDEAADSGLDIRSYAKQEIKKIIAGVRDKSSDENMKGLFSFWVKYSIKNNLTTNFQIPNLSGINKKNGDSAELNVNNTWNFKLIGNEIESTLNGVDELYQLLKCNKIIYLESPIYWKLKNVLEDAHNSAKFSNDRRGRISGIPGYFYDLARDIKYEYTGDMAFQTVYEKLTGKDVLGGKLVLSEFGDFSFQENGSSFSLPVTALGVANLGMLALLIERKTLDEDSFLFIDEPEAHLHPAWQVIMAETLFELAKGGAHVVIATHSADLLKWLEVHIKKNPDDENLVALNKFPIIAGEFDDYNFKDKIAAIKQELTKPFAELYTAGL